MTPPTIPLEFPALPHPPDDDFQWSADVLSAHKILSNTYNGATQLLRQEDGDTL